MTSSLRYAMLPFVAALTLPASSLAAPAPATLVIAPPPPADVSVAGAEWSMYNKDYSGQRYSLLRDLSPKTVDSLDEVCRVQVASNGSLQAGPVVVGGTLYVTTEQRTLALDARTCAVLWVNDYRPDAPPVYPVNRGVAVLDGLVFRGTSDGRLLALDAATGRKVWKDVIAESESGEYVVGAPLAWNGEVITGIAGGDFGARGRILAFNARSGLELWRFNTIPTGKEPGADSWRNPQSATTGGGGTWSTFALDPKNGALFVPVGNPAPDLLPAARPGDDLFTDSLVVLDARTGALRWWYQLEPHESQDLDLAAAPMLYRNRNQREVVAISGKDGYLRVIDRDTHMPLFRTPVTSIENLGATPTPQGTHVCPGNFGGSEWNGAAIDPARRTLYVGTVDWCTTLVAAPDKYIAGRMFFGGIFHLDAHGSGWITAVDADTGAIRWRYHAPTPVLAGITPTAGGVVLAGDVGGDLLIFDSSSGKLLRKLDTGGALSGGIVTYELDGKQYVAFDSGNVSRTVFGALGRPSIVVMREDAAPVAGDDPQRGSQLYAASCGVCHGSDGSGVPGHNLQQTREHLSFDQMLTKVENPTAPMPKQFPSMLSSQDVRDIVTYIRTGL